MIFRKKLDRWEVERELRDRKMRRKLLEFLQDGTQMWTPGVPKRPDPMMDDEQVSEELKRILGG